MVPAFLGKCTFIAAMDLTQLKKFGSEFFCDSYLAEARVGII